MSAPASPAAAPPGRIRYLVALLIFLAGMAGMAAFLINRLSTMQDGMTRLVVPGEQAVPLTAGSYTIFHETHSVIDGVVYSSPGLGGLVVTVTGPDGDAVPLSAAGAGRYSFGGHAGYSIFDFTAPVDGDYVVTGRYQADGAGPETVIAVGAGFMSSLLGTIFGSLGIAFAGSIIAAALAVMTLVQRRRAGLRF
jgi:hypothetical protein